MKKLNKDYKIESRHNCIWDFVTLATKDLEKEREIAIDTNDIEMVRYTRILLKVLQDQRLTKTMLEIADDT